MKRCPNCGYSTENNEKFCQYCGSALVDENTINATSQNRCSNCGNVVSEGMEYCPFCGNKMNKKIEEVEIPKTNDIEEDIFDQYYSNSNSASSSKVCPTCGMTYNSRLGECPNCSKNRYNYPKSTDTHSYSSNKKTDVGNGVAFGIICIIASCFTGIIGIIMSIVGISKFKKNKAALVLCIIALLIGITMILVSVILFMSGETNDLTIYF